MHHLKGQTTEINLERREKKCCSLLHHHGGEQSGPLKLHVWSTMIPKHVTCAFGSSSSACCHDDTLICVVSPTAPPAKATRRGRIASINVHISWQQRYQDRQASFFHPSTTKEGIQAFCKLRNLSRHDNGRLIFLLP